MSGGERRWQRERERESLIIFLFIKRSEREQREGEGSRETEVPQGGHCVKISAFVCPQMKCRHYISPKVRLAVKRNTTIDVDLNPHTLLLRRRMELLSLTRNETTLLTINGTTDTMHYCDRAWPIVAIPVDDAL